MLRGLLLSALLLALVSACSGSDSDDGRLRVVATTTQIGDFARQVGGDRIRLTVLLKPNQDAHDFELAPSQVRAISEANVVLVNGLGLDGFVGKALGSSHAQTVIVTQGISTIHSGAEGGPPGEPDPHVWFSAVNAVTMVENVRDALSAADGANASAYGENAMKYAAELRALDSWIKEQVAHVPPACRKLVTNHDVLGYYAAAYGFEVVGSVIPATSTQAGASATDVAEIVRAVRAQGVPAVFAEASVNPALIRQVGREAGVKVVDDLYGDSLGPSGSDGATYVKMMETNTRKIVEALKACPR